MSKNKIKTPENMGLLYGYKPNRISFYIILLQSHRYSELRKVLFKDMEKYKENKKE